MRKNHLVVRRIAVPILTLALLVSSWAPSFDVKSIISENARGSTAIVEIYNGSMEAQAAQKVDWNKAPKNYDVKVYIDNKDNEVVFPTGMGKPFIAEGRTFVPYRIMCEALGANVNWDGNARKVTAEGNNSKVELFIGNSKYRVNGAIRVMDVEPFILSKEGRTYIPARYLTEGLNYKIDFAKGGKIMYIVSFTKGQSEAEMKEVLDELAKGKTQKPPVEQEKGVKNVDIKSGYATQSKMWATEMDFPEFIFKTSLGSIFFMSKDSSKFRFVCTSHDGLNEEIIGSFGGSIGEKHNQRIDCLTMSYDIDRGHSVYKMKPGDVIEYDIYNEAGNKIYHFTIKY